MNHETNMRHALAQARQALDEDEFPVGCAIFLEGRVLATARRVNSRRPVPSELDHAEIMALRQVEALDGALDRRRMVLYATLEPCLMCFGAILISGIGTLVYAYEDAMGGGTACDRARLPSLYRDSPIQIVSGVCRRESLTLFQTFYRRPHIGYWRDSLLERYTLDQG
ncbi:MAG: nucleoside deaminase [Desulfobacterales bacterium]|nr:nucleoside deaminase [Desulfobacterales bacterium]